MLAALLCALVAADSAALLWAFIVFSLVSQAGFFVYMKKTFVYDFIGSKESDRRLLPHRLRKEALFDSLFEHHPGMVAIMDRDQRLLRINLAGIRMLGKPFGELSNKRFCELFLAERQEAVRQFFRLASGGQAQTFESVLLGGNGYRGEVRVSLLPVTAWTQSNEGVVAVFQDVAENKRAGERIKHMAYYDDLTGLPNRRLFCERLGEVTEEYFGVSVFVIDIDRFKWINESLGHDYGNMLLLQIAECLTRCVGSDDFVARMEGDEYALFFRNVATQEQSEKLAIHIFKELEMPFFLQEHDLHITISMGIAMASKELSDFNSLMRNADLALTAAKENGKNKYQFYEPGMNAGMMERLTLENELRMALQQREFVLFYQPQFDAASGRLKGVEALLRWNHPQKGLVLPGSFIHHAEETGLIIPIGNWVVREACRQMKEWHQRGFPRIPVSVNLSTRQFSQTELVQSINQALQASGLEARFLELEITESATVDVDLAAETLMNLHRSGVRISIDDFGTGYSSLSYFKSFPIHRLKIDRSFVRDIMNDPNDAAIVTTIIAMAQNLNLSVIAEGVENEQQLEFLRERRCEDVQGFLFSPPLSAAAFEQVLKTEAEAAAADERGNLG